MEPRQLSMRAVFWVVFLSLAVICLGFLWVSHRQHRDAARTVELLRPLVAADARFRKVKVLSSTNGRAILSGSVGSDADVMALGQLVEQAQPAQKPIIAVEVLPSPAPN